MKRRAWWTVAATSLVAACVPAAGPALAQAPQVACTTPFQVAYCADLNDFYSLSRKLAQLAPTDPAYADVQGKQQADLQNLANPATHSDAFVKAVAPSLQDELQKVESGALTSLLSAAQAWDQARLDRDGGVASSSPASTDLVSRAGVTELVSAAVGIGAATATTSGDTATLHGNAGGLKHYLETGNALEPLPAAGSGGKKKRSRLNLHNLDLAVSFDLNSPSAMTLPVAGAASTSVPAGVTMVSVPQTGAQFTAVSARYAVSAPFDPNDKKFQDAWQTAFDNNKAALQTAAENAAKTLDVDTFVFTDVDTALGNTNAQLFLTDAQNSDPQKLAKDFDTYCVALLAQLRAEHPEFNQAAATALTAVNAYQQVNHDVVEQAKELSGYPLLLEYTYNRPPNQPATHVGRLIVSGKKGMALYTGNVTATIYDGTLPAGATYGRFRDIQAAGQVDRGFGPNNMAIVSASIYYQYQQSPTVLNITSANLVPGTTITLPANAQVLLGTAGSTVIGQIKTTINLKSGIKLPLAFKFANRTALLDSTDKVGQFGITYDFSSFASLLKGK